MIISSDNTKLEIIELLIDNLSFILNDINDKDSFKKYFMKYYEIEEDEFSKRFPEGISINLCDPLFDCPIIISTDKYGDNDIYVNTLKEFEDAINKLESMFGKVTPNFSKIDYHLTPDGIKKYYYVHLYYDLY